VCCAEIDRKKPLNSLIRPLPSYTHAQREEGGEGGEREGGRGGREREREVREASLNSLIRPLPATHTRGGGKREREERG